MGLDMYAFRVFDNGIRKMPDVDAKFTTEDRGFDENGDPVFRLIDSNFFYWRKHPDLHGWMQRLYKRKGGADPDFNCNSVRITLEDLDALEEAIESRTLPHTTDFFFGQSSPEAIETDRLFIRRARAAIREGDAIYYDSWW